MSGQLWLLLVVYLIGLFVSAPFIARALFKPRHGFKDTDWDRFLALWGGFLIGAAWPLIVVLWLPVKGLVLSLRWWLP